MVADRFLGLLHEETDLVGQGAKMRHPPDDARQDLRIAHRHGQAIVESVVIPVHFHKPSTARQVSSHAPWPANRWRRRGVGMPLPSL